MIRGGCRNIALTHCHGLSISIKHTVHYIMVYVVHCRAQRLTLSYLTTQIQFLLDDTGVHKRQWRCFKKQFSPPCSWL